MERVWYFAYGSNMQSATFGGRRGITPISARAARAPGWRLVLDKPPLLGPGPSFANIVLEDGAEVFGVVYEIGEDDLAHVELTEGVTLGNYRRAEITVVPLDVAHPSRQAFTLVTDKRERTLRPSEWIGFLRGYPTVPDSPEAAAARTRVDDLFAKLRR
jgi:gamma-glutamylcyclotransferase (GGCT)/AIG2-like uncharacterized protein YtfP